MYDDTARMDSIPRWFDGVTINLAENLLYTRQSGESSSHHGTNGKEDSKIAVTEIREGYTEVRDISWKELREGTAVLTSALRAHGVKKGDRVAIVASNSFDTLKVFMAIIALGGIFSSSSTDMGTKGVLDRCLQIEPQVSIVSLDRDNNLTMISIFLWMTGLYTMARRLIYGQKWAIS